MSTEKPMGKIAEITIEAAQQHDGSAVWDVTVMTSGVGIRYAVPDPAGLGPLHAAKDVLAHHLTPREERWRTIPGFAVLPKGEPA